MLDKSIFKLKGLRVLSVSKAPDAYIATMENCNPVMACPGCGGKNMYPRGTLNSTYMDLPIDGHPVRINVKNIRYQCPVCDTTKVQTPLSMNEGRKMTDRLVEYIGEAIKTQTSPVIAKEIGCTAKTIRNVVNKQLGGQVNPARVNKGVYIGIRTMKIGVTRLVVTNDRTGAILDILPNPSQQMVYDVVQACSKDSRIMISPELISEEIMQLGSNSKRIVPCFTSLTEQIDTAIKDLYRISSMKNGAAKNERTSGAAPGLLFKRRTTMAPRQIKRLDDIKRSHKAPGLVSDLREKIFAAIHDQDKPISVGDYEAGQKAAQKIKQAIVTTIKARKAIEERIGYLEQLCDDENILLDKMARYSASTAVIPSKELLIELMAAKGMADSPRISYARLRQALAS